MSGLTVEQVNDLCDAIKTAYTTLGSKIADPDMKAAYAKMPPLIDSLRDLALAAPACLDATAEALLPECRAHLGLMSDAKSWSLCSRIDAHLSGKDRT